MYDASGAFCSDATRRANWPAASWRRCWSSVRSPTLPTRLPPAHAGTGVRLDRLRFRPGDRRPRRTPRARTPSPACLPAVTLWNRSRSSGRVLADLAGKSCWRKARRWGNVDLVAYAGAISWQNPVRATDVNGEGELTPLDALTVINYINAHAGDLRRSVVRRSAALLRRGRERFRDGGGCADRDQRVELSAVPESLQLRCGGRRGVAHARSRRRRAGGFPMWQPCRFRRFRCPRTRDSAWRKESLASWASRQLAKFQFRARPPLSLPRPRSLPNELHPLVHSATLRSPLHAPREWSDLEEILRDLAEDVAAAYEPSAFVG